MKASIVLVTILGMIAARSVTEGPIEDPQQKGSIPGDVSAVDFPIEDPQQETSISDDVSAVDDPIEDPQQPGLLSEDISAANGLNEDPQQDGTISDDTSAVDVLSRRKRASCCWKVTVAPAKSHADLSLLLVQGQMFGDYFQQPGLVNGHVHYTSSDGKYAIWWKLVGWTIGKVGDRGSAKVAAHANNVLGILGKPDCPHYVAFTWRYWNYLTSQWLNADKGLSIWCQS